MIVLREARKEDVSGLEELSKIAAENHPGFLNMAYDKEQWLEKAKTSIDSFKDKIKNKADTKFIFVAEDTSKKRLVGMSMLSAQHGSVDVPHFFFEVGSENKFSETINTGFIHGTLKLKIDTDGPTEIGGLLVHPDYRGNEAHVGRQISFVRFLYMGMNKPKFKRRVLAELLPPLTKKGKPALWEALGRRFTNMEYPEADTLSMKNKEFILSLFPTGKIYTTFLSAEARNSIGKVSKDTEPVLHMLKKIGFKYTKHIDPFDGGPHVYANLEEITPIKKLKLLSYGGENKRSTGAEESGLVTPKLTTTFRSITVEALIDSNHAYFPKKLASELDLKPGDAIYFMPYY